MKIVIIGGSGFLGSHVVKRCLENNYETWVFDLHPSTQIMANFFCGSIENYEALVECFKGAYAIIHCASPQENLNDYNLFKSINVDGSKNILKACCETNVKKLILISSASVVYQGQNICNGTEELPYANSFISNYIWSKIQQEKIILSANDPENNFLTASIRPHGIFGPKDKVLIPQILKAAKEKKMKFIIGDGKNLVDFTYVENVVHAIQLVLDNLDKNTSISGQAFNITNDEPIFFWEFIYRVLNHFNYDLPKYKLPSSILHYIAIFLSLISWVLSPILKYQPTFTPMRVALISTHHYYSCEKAKKLLGYKPLYSFEEGFQKMIKYFDNNICST